MSLLRISPLFLGLGVLALSALSASALPPVEPVRCLLYTPEEIEQVRHTVATDPVMKAAADEFLLRTARWMKMNPDEIEKLMPPADAVYAAGYAGDPKTDGPWSRWGRDGEVCSLDRPLEVKSPYTGDIYGIQKPGEPFYDPGQGWVRPKDGKVFYFKGYWNAFVIRAFHDAVDDLSVTYMLTGDPKYAERALLIMDRMATLELHHPPGLVETCIDFPATILPGTKYGFFTYDGNQGNDRMYASALAFDLIGKAAWASEKSPTNPALSVFENIRQNYFFVCERPSVDSAHSLQNHAVSAYASMLTQALLFGYPADIRKGIDASYAFLDGTIDRDGEYYEISASYSTLGREYGGRMLSLFAHYSPDRYPHPQDFPRREDYPVSLNFGDNPVWFKTAITSLYSLSALSRHAQYGDTAADRYNPASGLTDPRLEAEARHKMTFLKLFYHQTSNPEWKRLCSLLYYQIPEIDRSEGKGLLPGILEYGPSEWTPPPVAEGDLPAYLQEKNSVVVGQKRIAVLRSGEGTDQRALFIRGGSTAAHAHNDQMAVSYYADGLILNGTPGYYLWGTPLHRGYGTRAVAHATVVVDEDLPPSEFMAFRPPARITAYLPETPAQVIEMSDPELWPQSNLIQYRRQGWLIDISKTECYFVDAFWIDGGKTHDYVWQAPFVDPPHPTDLSLTGVTPKPIPYVWSLAALSGNYRNEPFNQKGTSWGERVETGTETMRPIGLPDEKLPANRWDPPPGNGYGFIWNVQGQRTSQDWSATWLLQDLKHLTRLSMVDSGDEMVVTGQAPSLKKDRFFDPVIARREAFGTAPLSSRFLTVTQVADGKDAWPVKSAVKLPGLRPDDVGLLVTHRDGVQDMVLAAGPANEGVQLASARLQGKRGFVRKNPAGKITELMLNEGTSLETGGITLRLPAAAWKGTVTRVSSTEIAVDTPLPNVLETQGALFSSAPKAAVPYSSNEFFTIEGIKKNPDGGSILKFQRQSVIAAKIKVAGADFPSGSITTDWPDELACQMPKIWVPNENHQTRVFDGHRVRAEDSEKSTVVTSYLDANTFVVENPYVMTVGKFYDIMAVQPTDQMMIPSFAVLQRTEAGGWELRANMDTDIAFAENHATWTLHEPDGDSKLVPDVKGFIHIPISALKNGEGVLASSTPETADAR